MIFLFRMGNFLTMKLNIKKEADHEFFIEELNKPLKFQFTRNHQLIAEYKELRERLYKIDPRFVGFRIFTDNDAENYENDPDDQMLILHDNNRVYGGACLRISTPQHPVILDLEKDIIDQSGKGYFSLKDHIPHLELDRYSYTEFNRIVLDPELRGREITREMFKCVLDRCIEYKVRYMFGIGDAIRTRLYMQIYAGFNLIGHRYKDIDILMRPEYENIKMHLISGDMRGFHYSDNDPEAKTLLSPRDDFKFD